MQDSTHFWPTLYTPKVRLTWLVETHQLAACNLKWKTTKTTHRKKSHRLHWSRRHWLDWIVQCLTSPPTQYRLYGRRFLQVKRPNEQKTLTVNKQQPYCWINSHRDHVLWLGWAAQIASDIRDRSNSKTTGLFCWTCKSGTQIYMPLYGILDCRHVSWLNPWTPTVAIWVQL